MVIISPTPILLQDKLVGTTCGYEFIKRKRTKNKSHHRNLLPYNRYQARHNVKNGWPILQVRVQVVVKRGMLHDAVSTSN